MHAVYIIYIYVLPRLTTLFAKIAVYFIRVIMDAGTNG